MLLSHPGFYSLVDALRKEQKLTEDKLVKLRTGIVYKRKPNYVLLDERLKNVLSTYDKSNFIEFYQNIQLILDY